MMAWCLQMCDWVAAPAGAVGVADHDFLILPHLSECWVPTGGGVEGGAPHYKYIYYKCTIIRSDYLALTTTFAIIQANEKVIVRKIDDIRDWSGGIINYVYNINKAKQLCQLLCNDSI